MYPGLAAIQRYRDQPEGGTFAQEFLREWVVGRVVDGHHDNVRMTGQDSRHRTARREHLNVDVGLLGERVPDDIGKQPRKVDQRHTGSHGFRVIRVRARDK
jgi:hypothetical protein